MAGRKTYLRLGSTGGNWVRSLPRQIDWSKARRALGRTLTPQEREHVVDVVAWHTEIIKNNDESRVKTQDVKGALRGIAQMDVAHVRPAYGRADRWTRAEIDVALRQSGVTRKDARPEQIRAAAAARISAVRPRPGRRTDTGMFDRALLLLWQELSGSPSRPAARYDYATPIVAFAHALCTAAGGRAHVSKAAIADRLRKAGRLFHTP